MGILEGMDHEKYLLMIIAQVGKYVYLCTR